MDNNTKHEILVVTRGGGSGYYSCSCGWSSVSGELSSYQLLRQQQIHLNDVELLKHETPNIAQPPSIPNDAPATWDLVIADIKERDAFGLAKYKTRLQPNNGRNSLVDAYQEALDLTVYLRNEIAEREKTLEKLSKLVAAVEAFEGAKWHTRECEVPNTREDKQCPCGHIQLQLALGDVKDYLKRR